MQVFMKPSSIIKHDSNSDYLIAIVIQLAGGPRPHGGKKG